MIDLDPLKYTMADAQRHGKTTVEIDTSALQAMIHKIHRIQLIENLIPKQIGYCSPDEIREMCNGRGKVAKVKRSPWSVYQIPIYFMGPLPKNEKPVDVVAQTEQNTPLQSDE